MSTLTFPYAAAGYPGGAPLLEGTPSDGVHGSILVCVSQHLVTSARADANDRARPARTAGKGVREVVRIYRRVHLTGEDQPVILPQETCRHLRRREQRS